MRLVYKLLSVLILVCAPGVAFAYVDPGTGAYAVQVLMTLLGAAAFHLAHPIRFLRALWARLRRKIINN